MDAFETTLALSMEQAEAAVRAALGEHGFGVLTEIDVAATLKAKLGVERPACKILGACNPGFADQVLSIDPSAALLLPCNVVLESGESAPGEGPATTVRIVDPRALLSALGSRPQVDGGGRVAEALGDLAAEAAAALEAAVEELTPARP